MKADLLGGQDAAGAAGGRKVDEEVAKADELAATHRAERWAQAGAGDAAAVEALVTERHAALCRLAAGLLGRAAQAEDVVQEAWVRVLSLLQEGRLQPEVADAALHRTVVRGALDTLRRRRRREGLLRLFGPLALRPAPTASRDPMARDRLGSALEALDESLRVPFLLRELEGWSGAEIAEAIGVSVAATEKRISRVRALLRERLTGEGVTFGDIPADAPEATGEE